MDCQILEIMRECLLLYGCSFFFYLSGVLYFMIILIINNQNDYFFFAEEINEIFLELPFFFLELPLQLYLHKK